MNQLEIDNIIFEIIQKKLKPDDLLKKAVKDQNLELIKTAMEYGACVTSLTENKSISDYLNSIADNLADLLAKYSRGENNGYLSDIAQELMQGMYGIDNRNSINRNERYEQIDKTHHWSVGLITREFEDPDFLSHFNEICDLSDWSDRFSNVSTEEIDGFYLISTVNQELPYDIDTQYISANITARYNLFMVDAYSLKNMIGTLILAGGHDFMGIGYIKSPDLFQFDGRIDMRIFDRMKNTVSALYRDNQG